MIIQSYSKAIKMNHRELFTNCCKTLISFLFILSCSLYAGYNPEIVSITCPHEVIDGTQVTVTVALKRCNCSGNVTLRIDEGSNYESSQPAALEVPFLWDTTGHAKVVNNTAKVYTITGQFAGAPVSTTCAVWAELKGLNLRSYQWGLCVPIDAYDFYVQTNPSEQEWVDLASRSFTVDSIHSIGLKSATVALAGPGPNGQKVSTTFEVKLEPLLERWREPPPPEIWPPELVQVKGCYDVNQYDADSDTIRHYWI